MVIPQGEASIAMLYMCVPTTQISGGASIANRIVCFEYGKEAMDSQFLGRFERAEGPEMRGGTALDLEPGIDAKVEIQNQKVRVPRGHERLVALTKQHKYQRHQRQYREEAAPPWFPLVWEWFWAS